MANEAQLEERDPLPDEVFRVLLDLQMVSGPWPLDGRAQGIYMALLTAEAHKRGYNGWVQAYHKLEVGDDG